MTENDLFAVFENGSYDFDTPGKIPLLEQKLILKIHEIMSKYWLKAASSDYSQKSALASSTMLHISDLLRDHESIMSDNEQLFEAYYLFECLKLCYFLPDPNSQFCGSIEQWANRFDPGYPADVARSVMEKSSPDQNPMFWTLLVSWTQRGLLLNVAEGLSLAAGFWSDVEDREIASIVTELCRSYSVEQFREWKRACGNVYLKYFSGVLSPVSTKSTPARYHLQQLVEFMKGDEITILKASSTWYLCVLSLVKYHDPSISRLPEYLKMALNEHPADASSPWQLGSAAAMGGHLMRVVEILADLSTCFAAVTVELCDALNLFDAYALTKRLAEYTILSNALNCLKHPLLVKVGVENLLHLGTPQVMEILANALPKINYATIDDMDWAIGVAAHHQLAGNCEQLLEKSKAVRLVNEKKYFDALIVFYDCQDWVSLRHYAWQLFEETLLQRPDDGHDQLTKDIALQGKVEDLPREVAEALAPYAILLQAFDALYGGEIRNASKLFLSLIEFSHLPDKYIGVILVILTPFLQRERPRVFTMVNLAALAEACDRWSTPGILETTNALLVSSIESVKDSEDVLHSMDWRRGYSGSDYLSFVRLGLGSETSRCMAEFGV